MSPELVCTSIEEVLAEGPRWAPRLEDLLPLWLTRREAEAVLELCAVSPAEVESGAEGALFGKLGQLLRAFQS